MHVQTIQNRVIEESVFPEIVVNLLSTYHWCNHILKENLSAFDITVQQYYVLRILDRQHPKPSTVNVIKSNMIDKMSDASRIIDRLIEKNMVRKAYSKADKRAAEITLSARGLKLLAEIDEKPTLAQLLSTKLTAEEGYLLNSLLQKLRLVNDVDVQR